MFYNYFTGQGVSVQTLANNVVDILAKSVPGLQTGRLARSLAVKLKAIVNTTKWLSVERFSFYHYRFS